ncbi:MAG: hypothetical protein DMD96_16355 [Candidatus Rokuibacteriota bacterium]|nr:MAG: hypothetical protein DMD96_16355 [Candidatus Rokubacteria bacterium]
MWNSLPAFRTSWTYASRTWLWFSEEEAHARGDPLGVDRERARPGHQEADLDGRHRLSWDRSSSDQHREHGQDGDIGSTLHQGLLRGIGRAKNIADLPIAVKNA